MSFIQSEINDMRGLCKDLEQRTRTLKTCQDLDGLHPELRGESIAQLMLAVRHIEDARMRLGKVLQYAVGSGVSILDAKPEAS